MAILILGKTVCKICGNIIDNNDKFVSLPAFVFNDCDPLFFFNDSAFHENCFWTHESSKNVTERVERLFKEISSKNRVCIVCKNQIIQPDDYLFLGFITDNTEDDISKYGYTKLHLSCLPKWKDLNNFKKLLAQSISDKAVEGSFYETILTQLNVERL